MSEQSTIESPNFDQIRKESGYATENGIRLLWQVLNQEVDNRRTGVRIAKSKLEGAVVIEPSTTSLNNYDIGLAMVVYFSGASAIDLTGIRNGIEPRIVFFHVLGAGTVTAKHLSGSSDVGNQIKCLAGADKAITTGKTFVALYLNGKWRELQLA